jgi:phosphatidate cytidylyltransferase
MSNFFDVMTMLEWMGMAAVVVGSATLGDLVESSMKREMQIKDSGNILPGHGGMLDRFDSTLFAVPAGLVYLSFIGII